MAAGTDIVVSVMDAVVGLGVPWWGWAALVVMIFWGLLGPGQQPTAEELEAELARARIRDEWPGGRGRSAPTITA